MQNVPEAQFQYALMLLDGRLAEFRDQARLTRIDAGAPPMRATGWHSSTTRR
jgi:hypothetical protein